MKAQEFHARCKASEAALALLDGRLVALVRNSNMHTLPSKRKQIAHLSAELRDHLLICQAIFKTISADRLEEEVDMDALSLALGERARRVADVDFTEYEHQISALEKQ